MSLSAGQRLGPYEVVGPLGAGGMGEVFTARDTRLDRLVAVKVLPDELASDPDRRARFEREARAISALSHPNVCSLFDVGRAETAGGTIEYLVMERLEGETLATRLERGPLPVPEALALGSQLAGALAAAHHRGIVHRDLKPANVMLTRSGAKLLDFGLARDGEHQPKDEGSAAHTHTLATENRLLTRVGTLVGTWPYLSPERLRGGAADARSDIFALGCVLHEALTGRRAFQGATPSDVTAAILGAEPADLRESVPGVPAALAVLVQQCLAKDPDTRWQCADDVARGLRLAESATGRVADSVKPPAARWRWALATSLLALAAAAAAMAALVARRPLPARPLRFAVMPEPGVLLARPTAATPFAVSPDGRRIAFVANAGGASSLWLWSAQDGLSHRLEDASGGIAPFFSPDGREVAFFAGDELKRVPCDGGPATTIVSVSGASSGSWGSAGTILYMKLFGPEAGIYAVPAAGGIPRALAGAPSERGVRAFPRFLPDGRHYLVLMQALTVDERRICVASVDGGELDCLASCHSQAEYSGSGHLLCIRGGTLVALPFDVRTRKLTGEAVPVAREVRWFGPSGSAAFGVSADGSTLVYEPRPRLSQLAWLDRSGHQTAAVGEPNAFGLFQLAPDGRRVAVDIVTPDGRSRELWTLDTTTGVANRLTFGRLDALAGVWSPDGKRLAFGLSVGGPPDVTLLELDGSGREQVLLKAPGVQMPKHWSPDGRYIAYEDYSAGRRDQRQLWLLALDGTTRRVTNTPASSFNGRFSPDGRELAYVSDESGRPEVYVTRLSGGPSRRISRAGGMLPRWRGDGRELFFLQPDGLMMAAAVADEALEPRSLFHLDGVLALDFDFDVARDGQRFLVRLTSEPEGAAGLRVSLAWSDRLGKADDANR